MTRGLFLALLFLFAPHVARAQAPDCVDRTQSWTQPYQGPQIQSVTYITNTGMFIATFFPGIFHFPSSGYPNNNPPVPEIFLNVPLGTAQRFQQVTSADQLFATSVGPVYHQLWLADANFCPVLTDPPPGSYIWIK